MSSLALVYAREAGRNRAGDGVPRNENVFYESGKAVLGVLEIWRASSWIVFPH